MLECDVSHDDIMAALLQPSHGEATSLVTCLFISENLKYDLGSERRCKSILDSVKKKYATSLDRSQTSNRVDASTSTGNQEQSSKSEIVINESDKEELVHLMHNRPFTLFDSIIDEVVKDLQSPALTQILKQSTYIKSIFPDCFRYLGQYLPDTNLTSLNLFNNKISSDAFFNLVEHFQETQIASLNLPVIDFSSSENVTEQVAPVSNDSKTSQDGVAPIDGEAKRLEILPTLLRDSRISSLDFSRNSIDMKMLTSSLIGSKITVLGLSGCRIQDDGLSCLANVLKDTQIESINISDNSLDCESLKLFAPGLVGTNVKALNLSDNRIGVAGINCLGQVLKHTQINSIDASCNELKRGRLEKFVNCLIDSKVTSLFLQNCDLSVDNLNYLARALRDTHITCLCICVKECNRKSMPVLSAGLVGSKVETLILSGSYFDTAAAQCLTHALKSTQIKVLDVSDCSLLNEQAKAFLSCLKDTRIHTLKLERNYIILEDFEDFYEDFCSLISDLKNTELTTIDLSGNDFSSGILDLLLADSKLTSIGLRKYIIDNDKWETLGKALKNSKITSIDINDSGIEIFAPFLLGSNITSLHLSFDFSKPDALEPLTSVLKDTRISSLNLFHESEHYDETSATCNNIKNLVLCLPETNITSLTLDGMFMCCNFLLIAFVLKYTQITSFNIINSMYLIGLCSETLLNNLKKQYLSDKLSLDLSSEGFCTTSLCFLAHLFSSMKITSLNLSSNLLENNAMKHISRGLINSNISELDLTDTRTDCTGVFYLSEVLRLTRIKSLNLSENRIACKGAQYLAECLPGTRIVRLNLRGNRIACEGVQYLAKCLPNTRIVELNLRDNRIACEGAQYLAECLPDTRIVKLDLSNSFIGWEAAHQLCESARQKSPDTAMDVQIQNVDKVDPYNLSMFSYPGIFVQIYQALPSKQCASGRPINKIYKKTRINLLILEGDISEDSFDDIDITEVEIRNCDARICIDTLLGKIHIVELRTDLKSPILDVLYMINVIALHLEFPPEDCFLMDRLKRIVMENNIFYLDVSRIDMKYNTFEKLVEVLQSSKMISLNLSNSKLVAKDIELLARALPNTKLTYIDLHGNEIGYAGFEYLLKDVHKTSICWLSLGNNGIEKELQSDVELSPYIVQRKDSPVEFQIRYIFRELVSLNADNDQFEFTVPPDNSVMTLAHYPCLVKHLLDPIYKVNIYDYFYIQNNRRHDIRVLNRLNDFVREIEQNFISFFESKMVQMEERFGDECFLKLVEEFDRLNLTDVVEFLLLHRSLYYVDEELNFLHPFIYIMLHKYKMSLYNENLEPNKKQQIIVYFQERSFINGAQDIIDLLRKLD